MTFALILILYLKKIANVKAAELLLYIKIMTWLKSYY